MSEWDQAREARLRAFCADFAKGYGQLSEDAADVESLLGDLAQARADLDAARVHIAHLAGDMPITDDDLEEEIKRLVGELEKAEEKVTAQQVIAEQYLGDVQRLRAEVDVQHDRAERHWRDYLAVREKADVQYGEIASAQQARKQAEAERAGLAAQLGEVLAALRNLREAYIGLAIWADLTFDKAVRQPAVVVADALLAAPEAAAALARRERERAALARIKGRYEREDTGSGFPGGSRLAWAMYQDACEALAAEPGGSDA